MNWFDWLLLGILAVLFALALRHIIRQAKKGQCCGCSGCEGCKQYADCSNRGEHFSREDCSGRSDCGSLSDGPERKDCSNGSSRGANVEASIQKASQK